MKKRILPLALVLTAFAVSIGVFLTPTHIAKADTTEYTFAQAVNASIINPTDYGCTNSSICVPPGAGSGICGTTIGCSFCSSTSNADGFDTAAAAEAAMEAAPETASCVSDPRNDTFVTGTRDYSQSGSGKEYAQQESQVTGTVSVRNGWRASIESGLPDGSYSHDEIYAHIHCIDPDNFRDIEFGWYWSPAVFFGEQVVYDETGTTGTRNPIRLHPSYLLVQGKYYNFRCHGYGTNGTVVEIQNSNGGWDALDRDPNGNCVTPVTDCMGNIGTELTCQNTSNCPNQNAPTDGTGINYANVQYKISGSWYGWLSPPVYTTVADHPTTIAYYNCGYNPNQQQTQDLRAFRTPKNSSDCH